MCRKNWAISLNERIILSHLICRTILAEIKTVAVLSARDVRSVSNSSRSWDSVSTVRWCFRSLSVKWIYLKIHLVFLKQKLWKEWRVLAMFGNVTHSKRNHPIEMASRKWMNAVLRKCISMHFVPVWTLFCAVYVLRKEQIRIKGRIMAIQSLRKAAECFCRW